MCDEADNICPPGDGDDIRIKEENTVYEIEYIDEYIMHDQDTKDYLLASDEASPARTKIERIDIVSGELQNAVWSTERPNQSATVGRKLAQARSAPLGLAKLAKTPGDCLSRFLDADVIATITEYTNARINAEKSNYARERDANPTDDTEMMALLGILYIASTVRDGRENVEHLFDTKKGTGLEAVYITTTAIRYHFLMRNIRFDDPETSEDDAEADKLAPIRAIYERVVGNFQRFFRPGRILSLDEQSVQFKGACDFRQLLPRVPGKTGFKFHLLVDCDTSYITNLEICVPDNENPYKLSYAPVDVAMRVTEPVQGKHKTIIMGPAFTSLELTKKLFDARTMVIGEIDKTHPDIPQAFVTSKGRNERCTLSAYHESAKLISYVNNRKGLTLLMSSYDDEDSDLVEQDEDKRDVQSVRLRPIEIYKKKKNTARAVQQMCAMYDVARSTRRWSLSVFFNLMNLSAINAWCIYRLNNPTASMNRREFLIELALELLRPQARRRLDARNLPRMLRQRIGSFLGLSREEYEQVPVLTNRRESRGRCHLCGRTRNKTTRISCHSCGKYTCNAHCAQLCRTCYMDENDG